MYSKRNEMKWNRCRNHILATFIFFTYGTNRSEWNCSTCNLVGFGRALVSQIIFFPLILWKFGYLQSFKTWSSSQVEESRKCVPLGSHSILSLLYAYGLPDSRRKPLLYSSFASEHLVKCGLTMKLFAYVEVHLLPELNAATFWKIIHSIRVICIIKLKP